MGSDGWQLSLPSRGELAIVFRMEAVVFEAIRKKLVGAWRDLRSRGLVTLFFFELLVVTLGVLLAQAVADWAANREDMAAMEKARARANLEMGDAAFVAQLWKKLGPCIEAEIDVILRSVASGEPIRPELLRRPRVFTNTVMPLSEETKLLIRERHGDDAAYNYDRMQRLTTKLDAKVEELEGHWNRLVLLHPELGSTSFHDRNSARETAVAIKADLTTIDGTSGEILRMSQRMRLEPKILGESFRFAENCNQFERFGRDFARSD